jgi:hypothetical protein
MNRHDVLSSLGVGDVYEKSLTNARLLLNGNGWQWTTSLVTRSLIHATTS